MVKNLPAVWETWVRSLGHEDPLEKGVATHSSILAWRSPWTEEPGGLVWDHKESDTTECLTLSLSNKLENGDWVVVGSLLQCSAFITITKGY